MKRDLSIAVIVVAIVAAGSYAAWRLRPHTPGTASHPFSLGGSSSESSSPRAVPDSKTVMTVNGEPVTEAEFDLAVQSLPEQARQAGLTDETKAAIGEQIATMKILEQKARKEGLDKDPKAIAQTNFAQTSVLAKMEFDKIVLASADPKKVQQLYDENKAQLESVDVSHILIAYQGSQAPPRNGGKAPSKEAAMQRAQQLVAQLNGGADFAKLAAEASDDTGSAAQGGKLGQIRRGMLPPELDSVVFAMKPGEIKGPVASQFGIHIFKLNGKSSQSLDEVRPQIAQRVGQDAARQQIETLRKTAKVDFDPKFFPPRARMQQELNKQLETIRPQTNAPAVH